MVKNNVIILHIFVMDIDQITELYDLITESTKDIVLRNKLFKLRKDSFKDLIDNGGFTKVAFDTRRIDQETMFNPRRGLQNYNRSEQFISQAISEKIIVLAKLRNILCELKEKYEKEPEWKDSYARILLQTLDSGLRTNINDGDFTNSQPGVGNLDYIEELLNTRYRLVLADMNNMSDAQIKTAILSKDEDLIHKKINDALTITKQDISKNDYDSLLNKLFDGVRADENKKSVERTITITIRDTILDDDKK